MSQRYSYFSWWRTHSRPKHVQKRTKHTKKIVHQVGFIYKIIKQWICIYFTMSWMVINWLNNFNKFSIYFHSNLAVELVLNLCRTRKWFLTVFVTKFSYLFPCPCHRQDSQSPSSLTSAWMGDLLLTKWCWTHFAPSTSTSPPGNCYSTTALYSFVCHLACWHVNNEARQKPQFHRDSLTPPQQ